MGNRDSHLASGPGRILVAIYGVFALAATGRATYQLLAHFSKAPLAYLLSALAAGIYLLAAAALSRGGPAMARLARWAISVEMAGVLLIGAASYLAPAAFPDKTVWSHFGAGYGYVPLVLPILGLWWLGRVARPTATGEAPAASAE